MLKGQKGITLVALVITIIVLVILVGVSISVAIQSGIIGEARNAGASYKAAEGSELNTLNNIVEDTKALNP